MTDTAIARLDDVRARGMGQVTQWPEPEQLAEPENERQPFPIHALGNLGGVARDIQAATLCPIGLAGVSVLSTASFAAQGRFDVQFVKKTSRPLTLYIITIGASGERKSSADYFAQIGVKRRIKALREKYRLDKAAVEAGTWDGGALLDPELVIGSGSVEGIAKGFVEGHPSQGLFNDEGGAFLSGHSLRAEHRMAGLAALSKVWDGQSPPHRTKGQGATTELIHAQNPRLAVHLLAQRVAVMPLLADPMAKGQGLLARFLVHEPTSTMGTRITSFEDWESAAVTARIMDFADQVEANLKQSIPRAQTSGEVNRPVLNWTEEASRLLHGYSMEVEAALAPLGAFNGFADVVNKVHEQAARISGTLAVFRGEDAISGNTMRDAIEIAGYFLSEIVRLAQIAPNDMNASDAKTIAEWIASKGGTCCVRLFSQNGPKSLRKIGARRSAVELLTAAGWLQTIDGKFHLSPKVMQGDTLRPV